MTKYPMIWTHSRKEREVVVRALYGCGLRRDGSASLTYGIDILAGPCSGGDEPRLIMMRDDGGIYRYTRLPHGDERTHVLMNSAAHMVDYIKVKGLAPIR